MRNNIENEDPELIESEAVDENEILVNENKIFNHESDDDDEDGIDDQKPLLGSTSKKSPPKEKKKIATTKMSDLLQEEEIKVSKKRWLMLFIFSLNTLMNGVLMVGLSPVTNLVSRHYNQSPTLIEWSTNIFLFLYIWFAIPASFLTNKFGIRKALILISCLNVLSTVFHMPAHTSARY